MIILDTNILSALMLRVPERVVELWLDRQARMSVWTTSVTVFEIRYGLAAMPAGRRRTEQNTLFERVINEKLEGRVLAFDEPAAEEAAVLMAERRRTGRTGTSNGRRRPCVSGGQPSSSASGRSASRFEQSQSSLVHPSSLNFRERVNFAARRSSLSH